MTPKEKAEQLVLKFRQLPPSSPYTGVGDGEAKQCALIAVDEIIKEKKECSIYECYGEDLNYWQKVKEKIKKL